MRRRTCHGPSRSPGERPLGTSNTKTAPHRLRPDRPSPPSLPPPCPHRRAITTITTALASTTCCPALCTGSLVSPFTVRSGRVEAYAAGWSRATSEISHPFQVIGNCPWMMSARLDKSRRLAFLSFLCFYTNSVPFQTVTAKDNSTYFFPP